MSLERLDHIVSGVLFDFAGFLTARKERATLSSADNAAPAADAVSEFMKLRGVDEDAAPFMNWNLRCSGKNVTNETVPECMRILSSAIRDDPWYAWSWHCNIAMSYVDEGVTPEQGNKAAARFMKNCFDVDTSSLPHRAHLAKESSP